MKFRTRYLHAELNLYMCMHTCQCAKIQKDQIFIFHRKIKVRTKCQLRSHVYIPFEMYIFKIISSKSLAQDLTDFGKLGWGQSLFDKAF